MQLSERWLRTMVDPSLSSDELARRLTMAGFEVEESKPVAPPFSGVVVGAVLEVVPHPNADKLRLTKVDAGTGALLSIVCGAPNVAAGMKVPCALIGAKLPGESPDQPFVIKRAQVRGIASEGMLCSASELGMTDEIDGLLALPADAQIGRDVREVLALDDVYLTLKLTPNRGDCLSMLGVARDLAAIVKAPLKLPATASLSAASAETRAVTITEPDACGEYFGRVISGLDAAAKTPE